MLVFWYGRKCPVRLQEIPSILFIFQNSLLIQDVLGDSHLHTLRCVHIIMNDYCILLGHYKVELKKINKLIIRHKASIFLKLFFLTIHLPVVLYWKFYSEDSAIMSSQGRVAFKDTVEVFCLVNIEKIICSIEFQYFSYLWAKG